MWKLWALLLVSSLIYPPLTATAQYPANTLQLGVPVERQLGPGQGHEFRVDLKENNLIQLVVEQRGVDVIVKVFSPSGKSVGEYDSPNGSEGPEHVSFVAATTGNYRVAVSPLDPANMTTGRFEIKILELRPANEEELKASKNLQVVKARGIALLKDAEEILLQIKSPSIRIRNQFTVGNLLWETDEKLANRFFSDAMAGFREFLASIEPDDQYFQPYSSMSQLRYEMVQVLAERDPDAALNFLHSTSDANLTNESRERLLQEVSFEVSIAQQLVRKDPGRALQLARRGLKKRYSANLVNTIRQLGEKHPEMAAELAGEIAAKLINEKLLKDSEAANLAVGLIRLSHSSIRTRSKSTGTDTGPALLQDDQHRELVQKMFKEALSYSLPQRVYSHSPERDSTWNLLNGLQGLGSSIETVVTGGEAAVRKKIDELNGSNDPKVKFHQHFQTTLASNNVNATLEVIEKAPPEMREQYYTNLANQLAGNGYIERAKQIINDHVSNSYQRRQYLIGFEQQRINQAMHQGNVVEVLRTLSGFRNIRERARQLAQIVQQIGPGQKRAAALNFLEQARSLLSPSFQAQDHDQMAALIEIARAFSRYDSKRSFEILDPLIDQLNELSAAAQALEGFGFDSFEDGELNLQGGGNIANLSAQMTRTLGTLALSNFDQAKAASDRIRLPEIRLKAYLDIADQAIQAAK